MTESILPIRDATTRDILYGNRVTTHRYELFEHDPATGADELLGYLDGVIPGGQLRAVAAAPVKKSLPLMVQDLEAARPGMIRIADINRVTTRIRPVLVIEGIPEIPLGMYVITAAPEHWAGTGRTYRIQLHEKSTVLSQDAVDASFSAPTGTPVLQVVKQVIESAGERIDIDASDTRSLSSPLVWEARTPKLTIVNELLDAINYNKLSVDGEGRFRATPCVRPADRSSRYTMLNGPDGQRLSRELKYGAESIYTPTFTRDRDTYRVPNKVIAIQADTGDAEPLVGVATNEDPNSEFSYQARGRWIVPPAYDDDLLSRVPVPDFSAEVDPDAATVAYLEERARRSLIARSSVQAAVTVRCLPIPVDLLDVVAFEHTPSGVSAKHTVQGFTLELGFDGLMTLELMEVIDL